MPFVASPRRREKRPGRFSVWSLLPIVAVLALVYYFYSGVQGSMEEVQRNEAKRIAEQPKERPAAPGLSRTQYDQQRSGHYGDAIKNSNGLKSHEQRTRDTEKAIEQISNSK
jgi:hypothetical protein